MKKNTHPQYRKVVFKDSLTGETYIIGTTMNSNQSIEIDGITYPLVMADVSASSHPFYTGKQKNHQQEGRIGRFNKRYGFDS